MAEDIIAERVAPVADKEFIVFLIGMRINKPWKFWKWVPVAKAMPRMIAELQADKNLGMMHAYYAKAGAVRFVVQYWESFDKLHAYANEPQFEHRPAWADFYKRVGMNGDVGIWHETYAVQPGSFEAIYGNMPKFGLGQCFPLEKAEGRYGDAIKRMAAE